MILFRKFKKEPYKLKICLIGNSGLLKQDKGGQTTKVRLFAKKIKEESCELFFVDLEKFKTNPFNILKKIKEGVATCDRIVLITSTNGCRFLIPYINHLNKKFKKPFILPLIGTSVLHYSMDRLSDKDKIDFICNNNYKLVKPKKQLCKQLSKITLILPETDKLTDFFSKYYCLDNCRTLNNFRDLPSNIFVRKNNRNDYINAVFLSRITEIKGIFDAIEVVKKINKPKALVKLSIYGELELTDLEKKHFFSQCDDNIVFKGSLDNALVINELSKYDLFIFPTKAVGEGTPGVIAEAFMAGIPVLSSNFPQANVLMSNGKDSIFYKMFDNADLEDKLLHLISDRSTLLEITRGALDKGKTFTYEHERKAFLKYVCGIYE